MQNKGFTLLELLIVIVIVGILSTLSVTHYTSYRERALGSDARANLRLIAAAERIWKMESVGDTYTACTCSCTGTAVNCCNNAAAGCNILLRLSLNVDNWTYGVAAAGTGTAATFLATATRRTGPYAGATITLNQADTWGGNFSK